MRKAGDDRKFEIESLGDNEDRGELAEHRKPAQPQNGVQADIAARVAEIGSGYIGHFCSLSARSRDHKFASKPSSLALPAAIAQ